MNKFAKVKSLNIPNNKRVICISDIHGEIDLFKQLLDKVEFCDEDILILLGDIYTKGSRPHDTLKYCMELAKLQNVHILRGNADWGNDSYLNETEKLWINELPDIIESDVYIFVHSGISSLNLKEQPPAKAKFNNFIETAPVFDKWVVVGHWPVALYCHEIPRNNPIIDHDKKIIAIDGGNVIKPEGQLNAFIIDFSGELSFTAVDKLPKYTILKSQAESGGSLSITMLDRFVEIIEENKGLCQVKHLKTGKVLIVPKSGIWEDKDGNVCICDMATDYHLPCDVGDTVSIVEDFEDRIFAKIDGICGWIMK